MRSILFNESSIEVQKAAKILKAAGNIVTIKDLSTSEALLEYKSGVYDLFVSGHITTTKEVIGEALKVFKVRPGRTKIISFMVLEDSNKNLLFFADCAITINPSAKDLVQIANDVVHSCYKLKEVPRVAFISYSTHGSGQGESAQKMKTAYDLFLKENPRIITDGELQMDAALNTRIYKIKTGKEIDVPFNIFIFTSLDTANTAYKTAAVLGNMKAYGPFVVGLEKDILDLSRSATSEEIVKAVNIALS